jgi:hypothetical protein
MSLLVAGVGDASFWSVLAFFAAVYCGFIVLALVSIGIERVINKIKKIIK